MEAADEGTKPDDIPLRAAFFRLFTCRELSNCMRLVGAGTPKGRKEELIASISRACSESLMHERVCHHLVGQLSFADLRQRLGQQHVDGKRARLMHMGKNKGHCRDFHTHSCTGWAQHGVGVYTSASRHVTQYHACFQRGIAELRSAFPIGGLGQRGGTRASSIQIRTHVEESGPEGGKEDRKDTAPGDVAIDRQ